MNMTNTPTYIYKELQRRGIPIELINEKARLMRYYVNGEWHLLKGSLTEEARFVGCSVCDNKFLSEYFARQVGLSPPVSVRYEGGDRAKQFLEQYTTIVVKPLNAAHGNGVSLNITSFAELERAVAAARQYSKAPPILQEMIYGDDLRLLLIGGKYTAAVRRVPAAVVGDGVHTVEELIAIENAQSHRSSGKRGKLKIINADAARSYLKQAINDIPNKGQRVAVVGVSNTSMGGHAEDATDDVPPEIRVKAEDFAKTLKLPVCGIDIMLEKTGKYYFIEANARPGFGPHHHPRFGTRRDVTKLFVDYLLETST